MPYGVCLPSCSSVWEASAVRVVEMCLLAPSEAAAETEAHFTLLAATLLAPCIIIIVCVCVCLCVCVSSGSLALLALVCFTLVCAGKQGKAKQGKASKAKHFSKPNKQARGKRKKNQTHGRASHSPVLQSPLGCWWLSFSGKSGEGDGGNRFLVRSHVDGEVDPCLLGPKHSRTVRCTHSRANQLHAEHMRSQKKGGGKEGGRKGEGRGKGKLT